MTASTGRGLPREIADWPSGRWVVVGAVTILGLLGLGLGGLALEPNTALAVGPSAPVPGWLLGLAALGAPLLGLLLATYRGAPIGATPTLCDLRWPAFGAIGLALAVQRPTSSAILGGLDAMGTATRVSVAVAALAVLTWAIRGRLALERSATAAAAHGDPALTQCSTCRPLFPTRTAHQPVHHTMPPTLHEPPKNGSRQ